MLNDRFAETDEVLDLMRKTDVRIFDDYSPSTAEVGLNNGFITVAHVSIENREVLLLEFRLPVRLGRRRCGWQVHRDWNCDGFLFDSRHLVGRGFLVQLLPKGRLCGWCVLRLRAVHDDLAAAVGEIRQVDLGVFIVGLPLVHLFFDPAATLDGVAYVFLEVLVMWRTIRVKHLQECAHGLLDALLITPLDCGSQANSLCDLLVAVGVGELIMKCFSQVVSDESVVDRQVLGAVLRHLPSWQETGETVHDCQVKLLGKRHEQIVFR